MTTSPAVLDPVMPAPNGVRRRVELDHRHNDGGLTLVELLVAFATLMILMTIAGSVITTYLSVGNNVTASYQASDQLLPSSIIIQRLMRSEIEPAPTLLTTVGGACGAANVPCPPYPLATIGSYATTFYANIGDPNGPAKIVMALSTPTRCGTCRFPSAQFTVTQYPAVASPACPFTKTSSAQCTWSAAGTRLVTVNNVVNGLTLSGSTPVLASPIFTYNTLDPYSAVYTPTAGGAASTTPLALPTGIYPGFATCAAPTLTGGVPTSSNCPADMVQSVHVDLQVQFQGSAVQENSFTVYRLSSFSFLYSTLVG